MQYSACESKNYVEIWFCVLVLYNIVVISRWNKIAMAVGRLFHIYIPDLRALSIIKPPIEDFPSGHRAFLIF